MLHCPWFRHDMTRDITVGDLTLSCTTSQSLSIKTKGHHNIKVSYFPKRNSSL